ncbi:TonB-dependent receptor domain-containing protein [Salisaeta longa]|uniref:TonB-dependent receptor domain-containing protein n=1 Tax=Salisaeta longa TaxID=503170 RepID=UPI0003B742C4|nr:TonB-dependent receptor [Salisaeta longa]
MRRLFCWIACLLFLAVPARGQNAATGEGVIQGRIIDASTNEPLISATVALWQDTTLVTGTVTQKNGTFTLEGIRPGTYELRMSYVGYTTKRRSITMRDDAMQRSLGTVALAQDASQLEGVEITGERSFMENRIDRTVYNTADQVTTLGGTAKNVLESIPSIQVDIDGSVSFRGNENVAIHINGKPTSLSGAALAGFLQSLPADAIASIEVIPNPSAKFDPEGMAGIINIVLKKNRESGWNGGLTAGVNDSPGANLSGNVGYQGGPWTLFTTYGFRYDEDTSSGYRFRRNLQTDPISALEQLSNEFDRGRSHSFTAQVDYSLSDISTLSLTSVLRTSTDDESGTTQYFEQNNTGVVVDRYRRLSDENDNDIGADVRLSFARTIKPRENELTVDLRYETDQEESTSIYRQRNVTLGGTVGDFTERERAEEAETEQEASFEVNYIRPLTDTYGIDVGYKADWERESTDFFAAAFNFQTNQFEPQPERGSNFTYDEQIHAAFGIVNADWGTWGAQVGVRAEQALTTFDLADGNAYDNNYFSLFPSAYLMYEPSQQTKFRLSYSKRINRPNSWQLNPVDDYEDPLFRRIGNPSLNPEYVHAFEFSATQYVGPFTLTMSPYFRRTVDKIEWQQRITPEGVTITTFENFATSNSYGTELVSTFDWQKLLRGTVSANAYRVVTDGSNVDSDLSSDALGYSGRINLTVTPLDGWKAQWSQFYRSPLDVPGGRIDGRTMTNVAVQRQLFNNKASISLQARDLFGTMNFQLYRSDNLFTQRTRFNWSAQEFSLTFTYTFGASDSRDRGRRRDGGYGGGDAGGGMMP